MNGQVVLKSNGLKELRIASMLVTGDQKLVDVFLVLLLGEVVVDGPPGMARRPPIRRIGAAKDGSRLRHLAWYDAFGLTAIRGHGSGKPVLCKFDKELSHSRILVVPQDGVGWPHSTVVDPGIVGAVS